MEQNKTIKTIKKWNTYPKSKQIGNIGLEVYRTLNTFKDNKNYLEYYGKVIEGIGKTIQDPKNKNNTKELVEAIIQLNDFLMCSNSFNNTEETIMKFYSDFINR